MLRDSKVTMATIKKEVRELALAKESYIYKTKVLYNESLPGYEDHLKGALKLSE